MSIGRSIEILKEIGAPAEIVDRFGVRKMRGTHIIGHTRMATESAVTTDGSHPFSTGMDLCSSTQRVAEQSQSAAHALGAQGD